MRFDFGDKLDDIKHELFPIKTKLEKNTQNIIKMMSLESNGDKMYYTMEKKIQKL